MLRSRPHFLAAASILALSAGSAVADVTAAQVWENWKNRFEEAGDTEVVYGNLSQSGGQLVLQGLELRQNADDASSLVTISEMTFTENGDGTVTVSLPSVIPITFSPNDDPQGNYIDLTLAPINASLVVGGSVDAMTYEFAADRLTLSANRLVEDGEEIPFDMLFNANGLTSRSAQTSSATQDISADFAARSFEILIGIDDGATRIDLSGRASDISATTEGKLPPSGTAMSMAGIRDIGGTLRANYASGPSTFVLTVVEDGEETNIVLGAASNRFDANVEADSVAMGSESTDLAIGLSGTTMPFPINLTAKALGQSFTFPVLSTEKPIPVGMSLNIEDLALDGQIWAMLDPLGAVPHEPLTLQYTIEGQARLRYDLDDPESTDMMTEGENPFEIFSANISGLKLAVAGAVLTGEGAFTFDNADTTTFPGMPRPEGLARLEAIGLNKLLDSLASVGLLPEEELMGYRMMLGMFTKVIGDDQLVSEVQVGKGGQILLNGQRLR